MQACRAASRGLLRTRRNNSIGNDMAKPTKNRAPRKAPDRASNSDGSALIQSGVDLAALDREDLLQLQKDVDRALRSYDKRRRDAALAEMEAVAQKHGLSLKELVQPGPGRPVAAPKYRHPDTPELTWSGRGRQPAWYKEAIEAVQASRTS